MNKVVSDKAIFAVNKKDIRVDVKIIVPKGLDVFGKKPLK